MSDWQPETLLGNSLGPYEVLEELGRGGMAVVFKAYQPQLERHLAIKVLRPEIAANRELKSRFHRESEAMANLNHPNVVKVIDRGEADGLAYFAMEWVDGPTLKQILQDRRISVDQLFAIATHTASALAHAHAQGIVHRDVKPANVLWETETKLAKVIDFGIARMTDPEAFLITLTQVNASLGTLDYMAPEQKVNAGEVDARADTYALGIMLYEMFVGFRPAGRFKLPSELNPKLPKRLDTIVSRCLEPEPQDRYPNMNEVVADLNRAQSRFGSARFLERDPEGNALRRSQRVPALDKEPQAPGAHPMTWLLACSALIVGLLGLSGAAYLWGPWRGEQTISTNTAPDNPLDLPDDDLPPDDPDATPPNPLDLPLEDPPVEDPPVEDPPVDPAEDPPKDPPVEDPPVEDPPVEDPPVEDPPVKDPDPLPDPPVDLDAMRASLRKANAQSAAIARALRLDMTLLTPIKDRATAALAASPGDPEQLHNSEIELLQLVPNAAARALDQRWRDLTAGTLPHLRLHDLAREAPRDCSTLASALVASKAFTRAEGHLRHTMLLHVAAHARQDGRGIPSSVEEALAAPPNDDPKRVAAYARARSTLLLLGPQPPKALEELGQEAVLKPSRTIRTRHRPFLWPKKLTRNEADPEGRIVAICSAAAERCAVVVHNRYESWVTFARAVPGRAGKGLLSVEVGVRLSSPPRAIAPGGLHGNRETFYLATKDTVHRLVVNRSVFTRLPGLINKNDDRLNVSELSFHGDVKPSETILALASDVGGSLYVLTTARIWRWSPTHEPQRLGVRGIELGEAPTLLPLPLPPDADWHDGIMLLLPRTERARTWAFDSNAAGIIRKPMPLEGTAAAAATSKWSVHVRGENDFSVFDGEGFEDLPRTRGFGAALGQVDAITISGDYCYVVDQKGGRMTAFRMSSK